MPVSGVHRIMWFVGRSHQLVHDSRLWRRHRAESCRCQSIRVQPQDAMPNTRNHQFCLYQLHEPATNLSPRHSSARRRSAKRKDLAWLVHSPKNHGRGWYCVVFNFSRKLRMIGDIVVSEVYCPGHDHRNWKRRKTFSRTFAPQASKIRSSSNDTIRMIESARARCKGFVEHSEGMAMVLPAEKRGGKLLLSLIVSSMKLIVHLLLCLETW